jgi:hypothetical protein
VSFNIPVSGLPLLEAGRLAPSSSQGWGYIHHRYIGILAWLDACPHQDKRFDQGNRILSAMSAAVDLSVVAAYKERVLGQVELGSNLA